MRVTDITAYKLSSPIDPPDVREFYGGRRHIVKRDVVLVQIEAADGEVGYATAGATSSEMREFFESVEHEDVVDVLESLVAPVLVDEPLDSIAEASERIHEETSLPEHLRWQTIGAVDVALHDLLGKRQGAPVYELLDPDAEYTTDLPLYASAGMYMDPEGYAEQARALRDRGFFGYKYRPGGGPERDRRTLERVHEAVGGDMEIMIDAHTWWKLGERSYDVDQVVELLSEFAEYEPYWVEEPIRPEDHAAYERVASRTDVPLAGGESEPSPAGLRALAETGAIDFLQADVRHHGGFTGCWAVGEFCAGRDVRFVPHHFGTDLGLAANAHLVAATPEAELLEYPVFGDDVASMYPYPLAEEILADELDISDGRLQVPTGPGLGVDVDLDVVDRYPPIEGPWTEFEYDR